MVHRHRPPSKRFAFTRGVAGFAATVLALSGTAAATTGPAIAESGDGVAAEVASELVEIVETASGNDPIQAVLQLPTLPGIESIGGDDESREEVLAALREHATTTQAEVEADLEEALGENVSVVSRTWLSNTMLVEFIPELGALESLGAIDGVDRVLPNFEVGVIEPVESEGDVSVSTVEDRTWGIDRIGAHRVWNDLGATGSGTVVAVLDTGVEADHPDLAGKMVTDDPADPAHPGGWMEFDDTGNPECSTPRPTTNHGTHVTGTIVGGDASGFDIGVAPDARYMHGLVIPGGTGTFAQVLAGMEWAVAPFDCQGAPAGATPDVVNMSLGAPIYEDAMIPAVLAMRAANVFPAMAIGNIDLLGSCGVGSSVPGNIYDSIGIGATDIDDNVAGFSCGEVVQNSDWTNPPSHWPDSYVKPDVSAPGVNVLSSIPGGTHGTNGGTSMATPHVAGTAALMQSAAGRSLTVEEMLESLVDTSFWDDRHGADRPNPEFGQGRIDAYEATVEATVDSGIAGTVRDSGTGEPIAGAEVTVAQSGRPITTDADGEYSVRLVPGTYDLSVELFGYETASATDIQVTEGAVTTRDVDLVRLPTGDITGTVVLDESGSGVPGVTVELFEGPIPLSDTTDVDGRYRLAGLPPGEYRVAVDHPSFIFPGPQTVIVEAGSDAVLDFELSAHRLTGETIAFVDTSATRARLYREFVFDPIGVQVDHLTWDELEQAADYPLALLVYGTSTSYDADRFQAFLDASDANGTGVLFLDHAFQTGNGLRQLSTHTGQPETTYEIRTESTPYSEEIFFETVAEHPILEGYVPGDRIAHENMNRAKWIAYFEGYEGEGRQIIADVGRTKDGILGAGIAVDERANNRHVLMSVHGASGTRDPGDWLDTSTNLFYRAAAWAAPLGDVAMPRYALHDLQVSPDDIQANDPVTVSVGVKNVGNAAGEFSTALSVDGDPEPSQSVQLDPGEIQTLNWTIRPPDLGDYLVEVDYLSTVFTVRAPIVELTAMTADQPGGSAPEPLAGAHVELYDDGVPSPMGATDADGELQFSIPDPTGRYHLVVRKDGADEGEDSYLLHRQITVIDDDAVTLAPRVLQGPSAAGTGDDFSTRVDLSLDAVDDRHDAAVYVGPAATAPYGYRFGPGRLIASLDEYGAVPVHQVVHLEQDWLLVGETLTGLDWTLPYDDRLSIGGDIEVTIDETEISAGREASVDWKATDAHGNRLATILASELRPFADLPDRLPLEDVVDEARSTMREEWKPILRLFDRRDTPLRGGVIDWGASPYTFTLDPDLPSGPYRVELEVRTGGYNGVLTTENWFVLPKPKGKGDR